MSATAARSCIAEARGSPDSFELFITHGSLIDVMARSQFKNKLRGATAWTKRNKKGGEFMAVKRPARKKKAARKFKSGATREVQTRISLMPGPMLTIVDLLRGAADALEEAYRGREDVPPASLALIVALRERVEHIASGKAAPDEAEPTGATVTQDEP
jgi:hypothetical protein